MRASKIDVPDNLLPMLTCGSCNNYLSRQPVMVSSHGRSVCGKCASPTDLRNFTYEAVAQLLIFPCRYQIKGCSERLEWNLSGPHESRCDFREPKDLAELEETSGILESCIVCLKNIFISPRYLCSKGHSICSSCTATSKICLLCQGDINSEPTYVCKFWTSGCKFKNSQHGVSNHEIDCDKRDYCCPFLANRCEWKGSIYSMSQHLKTDHQNQIVQSEESKRTFRMKDDSWVIIAYEDIFKCYVWIGESEVEWLAKYVGPQERSYTFFCEVRLISVNKNIKPLRMTVQCHGWNNYALERSMSVPVSKLRNYMQDGKLQYSFKIVKVT